MPCIARSISLALDRDCICATHLVPRYAGDGNGSGSRPSADAMQALVDRAQSVATGVARLKLFSGAVLIAGRKSPNSPQ